MWKFRDLRFQIEFSPVEHCFQFFLLFNYFSFWNAQVSTCTWEYFGVGIDWQLTKFVVMCRPEYNFFYVQTDCQVETMLRRIKWIWDQTTDKTFLNLKINCISKLSVKMFIKRKTRTGKAYTYRMFLNFKTYETKNLTSRRTNVSVWSSFRQT